MENVTKQELEIIEVALVHYLNSLSSDKFGREERHRIRAVLEKLGYHPSDDADKSFDTNTAPMH